ncbi:MAG: hypothetical protein DMF62_04760 [Acidobacteria bacterium]|nr:MAG: hypothetical protein DMF62_04760 [Acidobacteriota bacterium]
MRLKYNAASPNHRRIIPNPDPNRTDEDPEELVWESDNNFIVEVPDAQARKLLDEFPGELEEAAPDEPDTRGPRSMQEERAGQGREWVEKLDTDEGDDMSTEAPPETARTSRATRTTPRA